MRNYSTPVLRSALSCAFVLALGSCAQSSPIQPGDDLVLAEVSGTGGETERRDPAEIVAARIEEDTMHLTVRHGGGCEEHDFALLHFGGFRESYPVQTSIRLMHDAHGDMCRALVTRNLAFDLTPLKVLYMESYAATSGTMVLQLYGPAEDSVFGESLRYEF